MGGDLAPTSLKDLRTTSLPCRPIDDATTSSFRPPTFALQSIERRHFLGTRGPGVLGC